jgi:hypothetical protein
VTLGRIIRRCLLYLGLAFAALAAVALAVVVSERTGIVVPFPWAMLVAFSVLLIWLTMKTYRRFWASPAFWSTFAGLMLAHSTVFVIILRKYPGFRPIWFVPIVVVEALLFGVIFALVLPRSPTNSRRDHAPRL